MSRAYKIRSGERGWGVKRRARRSGWTCALYGVTTPTARGARPALSEARTTAHKASASARFEIEQSERRGELYFH